MTVIDSNSWPCSGYPNNPNICLRALTKHILNSVSLVAMTISLRNLFSA